MHVVLLGAVVVVVAIVVKIPKSSLKELQNREFCWSTFDLYFACFHDCGGISLDSDESFSVKFSLRTYSVDAEMQWEVLGIQKL